MLMKVSRHMFIDPRLVQYYGTFPQCGSLLPHAQYYHKLGVQAAHINIHKYISFLGGSCCNPLHHCKQLNWEHQHHSFFEHMFHMCWECQNFLNFQKKRVWWPRPLILFQYPSKHNIEILSGNDKLDSGN